MLKFNYMTVMQLLSFRNFKIFTFCNFSNIFICSLQKRYSLAVGPPKKVPKVKGVESAAVQAFLRRQEEEKRKKGNSEKYFLWETFIDSLKLCHLLQSSCKYNYTSVSGIYVHN